MRPRFPTPSQPQYQWPPRVQAAGVSCLEEALVCRDAGVDAIGLTLELPHGPHDGLTNAGARSIVRSLPPGLTPVIITYLNDARAAAQLTTFVGGAAVQFHGGMSDEQVRLFRRICPHVNTIARVSVEDETAIDAGWAFQQPLWDAIILDSVDPDSGRIGATGKAHDWSISARIVEAAAVPVILAGGLNPDNVTDAIRTVRPHGVDAHTGLEHPDGSRDYAKIRAFAAAALRAFAEIETSELPPGS